MSRMKSWCSFVRNGTQRRALREGWPYKLRYWTEGSGTMANVTGFDPAVSGQEPKDEFGKTGPVGVWGDSTPDVGVFGTSGAVPPGGNIVIASMLKAGVTGHGTDRPG